MLIYLFIIIAFFAFKEGFLGFFFCVVVSHVFFISSIAWSLLPKAAVCVIDVTRFSLFVDTKSGTEGLFEPPSSGGVSYKLIHITVSNFFSNLYAVSSWSVPFVPFSQLMAGKLKSPVNSTLVGSN